MIVTLHSGSDTSNKSAYLNSTRTREGKSEPGSLFLQKVFKAIIHSLERCKRQLDNKNEGSSRSRERAKG